MVLTSRAYYLKQNDLLKRAIILSRNFGIELEALLLSFYNYPYQ
jgi:hypothetical protein